MHKFSQKDISGVADFQSSVARWEGAIKDVGQHLYGATALKECARSSRPSRHEKDRQQITAAPAPELYAIDLWLAHAESVNGHPPIGSLHGPPWLSHPDRSGHWWHAANDRNRPSQSDSSSFCPRCATSHVRRLAIFLHPPHEA